MSMYRVGIDVFAKDRASPVLDDVGNAAKRSGGRFDSFKGKAVAAGALAGAALVKFGMDSTAAYVDAEKSQRVLEDAYKRFPALADVSIQSLRDQAAALQTKTKFDGDDINAMQGKLAAYGLTGAELQKLTPLVLDYAEKTGKDLATASEDMGKAVLGQTRALKAIGLDLDDTGSKSGNLTQLMGGLRKQVGGFAEQEGKSAEGKVEILKNKFGDLQESIGAKLLPAGEKLTEWLSKAVTFVDENATAIGFLVVTVGTIVAGVKAWSIAQGILNVVLTANPIGLVVIAVAALTAGIVWVATQTKFFQNAWKTMTEALGTAWRWVWNTIVAPIIRFILNGFANMTGGIASFLRALSNIPGFGWAKDAADKMDRAAGKARTLAGGIRDIPDSHTTDVHVNTANAAARIESLKRALRLIPDERVNVFVATVERAGRGVSYGVQERASGGRYDPGVVLVGEDGPELRFEDKPGYIVDADDTARLLAAARSGGGGSQGSSGGGDGETLLAPVNVQVEGETIIRVLLKIKRTRGGTELGLA